MFSRHPLLAASGVAAAILLSGCNTVADVWDNATDYVPYFLKPYRDDVHQGNLVTSEMVLQLEKGMTDAQVQFLLGVPLVRDQFHADRWDYVYFLMRGDGERQLRKLTVFFDENRRVDHWVSDPLPDEEQADQLILGNIKVNGEYVRFDDDYFRFLLFYRAACNIADATADTTNKLLETLTDETVFVVDYQDMSISSVVIIGAIDEVQSTVLAQYGLLNRPAGVLANYLVIYPDEQIFGFEGSDLEPFDQGVFNPGRTIPIY